MSTYCHYAIVCPYCYYEEANDNMPSGEYVSQHICASCEHVFELRVHESVMYETRILNEQKGEVK